MDAVLGLALGQRVGQVAQAGHAVDLGRDVVAAVALAARDRADELARTLISEAGSGRPATVLLSPAAASFDMFADYAARGAAFRAAAEAMARRRAVVRSRR